MKYHMFCGDKILSGYVNIDKFNKKADVVRDVTRMNSFYWRQPVTEVRMSHGLEHLDFNKAEGLLQMTYRILTSGGKLILVHPDALAAAEGLVKGTISERKFEMLVWGYQSNAGEYHYSGYTPKTIQERLKKVGFTKIKITHPRKPYEMKVEATK